MKVEDIARGRRLVGVDGAGPVEVVAVAPGGQDAITLVFRSPAGVIGERMLFREDEPSLAEATVTRPWSFAAGGEAFQLAAEALRIRFAHLFDPMMAVHTSDVEPLPHQISAVYEAMLPRQPLRFAQARREPPADLPLRLHPVTPSPHARPPPPPFPRPPLRPLPAGPP